MTIQAEPARARATGAGPVEARTTKEAAGETAQDRARSSAAQRAYARRDRRDTRPAQPAATTGEDLDHGTGRVSFAVLIIVLLVVGVAATLWLSTQAIADSYRLDQAKQESARLAERAAELQREVTQQESAASLAERAKAMGMVPAGDPARLVVRPDGTVVLVGEPTPVERPAPPAAEEQRQDPPAGGRGTG